MFQYVCWKGWVIDLRTQRKLMSTGKEKRRRWRSGMYMGWWFSGHAASVKGRSKKVKTSLCDIECCTSRGRCSSSGCVLLCLNLEWILYSSLFLKSDQLWSFFIFFTANVVDWLKNYFWFYFFVRNSINISPCTEPVHGDAFFFFLILERISVPVKFGESSPVLLIGIAVILFVR